MPLCLRATMLMSVQRTFLAWLRSSLSLVGVGVSITQLFRLKTSAPQYTPPTVRPHASAQDVKSPQLSHDDVIAAFTQWLAESQSSGRADYLHMASAKRARTRRYHKLGKPLGTAFVAMGILFLMLGGSELTWLQEQVTEV